MNTAKRATKLILSAAILTLSTATAAQWYNHYSKLDDFGHHVYLEQHELPILAHGITDPAPSPDGKQIAVASKGWLWLVDIESGVATRLTDSNAIDARPRWSPDGSQLAFVRDFSDDTAVVIKDLKSGKETLINTDAIELDPEFSADGRVLYYSSGVSGSLNVYQRDILSGVQQQITNLRQVERNVRRIGASNAIVYLHGNGAHRVLRQRDFTAGTDEIIQAQTLTYHLTGDVHPTQNILVYSAPINNDYHLYTMDLNDTRVSHRLTEGTGFALTPAFSADGNHIYFVELTDNRQFRLMHIPTYGGKATELQIKQWDYRQATGTLVVSIVDDQAQPIAARVSIVSESGHPVAAPNSASFDDPQTGRSYFYIDGTETFTLPTGKYKIEAVRGPMTQLVKSEVRVKKAASSDIEIVLKPLWRSAEAGYRSADFHVHLNGDGHHRASHQDALLLMKGEDLNYLAPMSWNRWERKIDAKIVGKRTQEGEHIVAQGQEVRSHFHGHIGLLNVNEPFTPWFFGPNNPTLGDPNLTNANVFAYASKIGAFATYVHPIADDGNPFADEVIANIPLELLSDGILEPQMGLELVCAWTSSLGTAELWYRLLNIGKPVAGISGTDSWVDFHRTPAVGTGRAYIRPLLASDVSDPILAGAIAGRSFLTTGPALIFSLENGAKPGDVSLSGKQGFSLVLTSAVALQMVEIVVNGQVVQTLEGIDAGETKGYSGEVDLPEGGWVAARAYAAQQRFDSWPSMHARPFAHSSPIWIDKIGSVDAKARSAAVDDLLRAINVAEKTAREAYGERPMPRLYKRFEDARAALQ
ncbi:CehA/McbA family metallohydrolase [Glaciecola sp. SC05]|uniref:CehA/McbA family metallohydrolase n=1 Tax=Glaciecola sp. SC05 TaxID=1987355 RepID=UPI003527C606